MCVIVIWMPPSYNLIVRTFWHGKLVPKEALNVSLADYIHPSNRLNSYLERDKRHGPFSALNKQAQRHYVLRQCCCLVSEGCLCTLWCWGWWMVRTGQRLDVLPTPNSLPLMITLKRSEKQSISQWNQGKPPQAIQRDRIRPPKIFGIFARVPTFPLSCICWRGGHN